MGVTYKMKYSKKLQKALELLAVKAKNNAVLNVGFRKGSTEPDGQPTPLVAFINEFGRTVNVIHPNGEVGGSYYQMPRPFFRRMIAHEQGHWAQDLAVLLRANDFDAVGALEELGEGIAGELQDSIQRLTSPPLAQSTIKKKGFSKPLIDTSNMWKNVTYWVEDKGEKE